MLKSRIIALSLFAAAGLAISFGPSIPAHAESKIDSSVSLIREHATDSFKQYERQKAMEKLQESGTPEGAVVLCELLGDAFPRIKEYAELLLAGMSGDGVDAAIATAGILEEGLHKDFKPSAERRAAAARVLGKKFAKDQVEALIKALEDKDDDVAAAGAWALGEIGGDDAIEALEKTGLRKKGAALGASLRALGYRGEKGEADDKVEKAIKDKSWQAAVGAADYCAQIGPDDYLEVLATGLDKADKSHQVRIAIAQALAGLKKSENIEASRPLWEALLQDEDWRVRRRTVEAMVEFWQVLSIDLLTENMPDENVDTTLYDYVHALEDLTGESQPYRADAWKLWWTQAKAMAASSEDGKYKMREKLKRPENGWLRAPNSKAREEANKKQRQDKGTDEEPISEGFFEIPVLSEDAYFVFDFSGSMRDALPGTKEPCKADIARNELFKVLESYLKFEDEDLRPKFNVLIYRFPSDWPFKSPNPAPQAERAFDDGMETTTDKTIAAAKKWIGSGPGKDKIHGWGAFYEAFVASMEDPECKVIYFLSDGAPSAGQAARWENLHIALKAATRFHPVRINTVLIGKPSNRSHGKLMQTIADKNCGAMTNPYGDK